MARLRDDRCICRSNVTKRVAVSDSIGQFSVLPRAFKRWQIFARYTGGRINHVRVVGRLLDQPSARRSQGTACKLLYNPVPLLRDCRPRVHDRTA